ncbi:MAG: recombination protein O N-terminal domain-containing protein [Desulfovibrionaceae bacterium]|nr:recombination protein O N-terminal domain-containing protein [Desulfovibrionaceae bacterium]
MFSNRFFWTDTGIVLRAMLFRESDVRLRLLTRNHGIVTAYAFGGRKSRRRFCGCLDFCNELCFTVQYSSVRRYLSMQEARLISGSSRMRVNRSALGMMVNCMKFIEAAGVPDENREEAYAIVHGIRCVLEGTRMVDSRMLPELFRLRIATMHGFIPSFSACSVCSGSVFDGAFLSVSDGSLICLNCAHRMQGGDRLKLSGETVRALNAVQLELPQQWPVFTDAKLADFQIRECFQASDRLVRYHLGIVWENGAFQRY